MQRKLLFQQLSCLERKKEITSIFPSSKFTTTDTDCSSIFQLNPFCHYPSLKKSYIIIINSLVQNLYWHKIISGKINLVEK